MYKVILIDDEPWTLIGMSNTVDWEQLGFKIIAKETNPLKAAKIICESKPDAIFTDIKMPVLSGLELIKKVRDEKIDSEIIIVSGYADFSYAQEAIRQGAFDYCLKPIEEDKLLCILKKLKNRLDEKNEVNTYTGSNQEFALLLEYINKNFYKKLKLKDIADKFYINSSYCSQLFRKELETTFSDYLTDIRMRKAKNMLKNTSMTIQQIACKVGISDYYYFNKIFKKYYGITPFQYRKDD